MRRKLNDWLTAYLEYTQHSESPISYHQWAGVSCISSALQRKCYMRLGHSTLYPNNYIILVGPSANARKGEPLVVARDIVDAISSVNIIGEDSTPEALIRDIRGSEITYKDETTGDMVYHSSITAFVEELAVFTGQQNSTFLAYLTNWYDSRDKWTRRTKHQGTDEITGICFNLLGATAPDWLPYILPREAVGGGFTSRCIFIVEDRKRKTVVDPNENLPPEELRQDLIHDLEVIQTITGRYEWSDDAKSAYEQWYLSEDEKLISGHPFLGDPKLGGYAGRRPSHIRKLSMATTASRTDDRLIELKDFERARLLMESAEKKMQNLFSGIGMGKYVAETDTVIKYLKSRRKVTRSQMLRDLYRDLDETSMKSIMDTLRDMQTVKVKVDTESGETWYEFID